MLPTDFSKTTYKILRKPVHLEPRCSMWRDTRTGGRTYWQTCLWSWYAFSNFRTHVSTVLTKWHVRLLHRLPVWSWNRLHAHFLLGLSFWKSWKEEGTRGVNIMDRDFHSIFRRDYGKYWKDMYQIYTLIPVYALMYKRESTVRTSIKVGLITITITSKNISAVAFRRYM